MTTVVCVGLAVRDVVFSVDAPPRVGSKSYATGRIQVGGGPAANAAVTISMLGGTARFIGPVGDDPIGADLGKELSEYGVDITHLRVVPGTTSSMSAVVVDSAGERTVINHTDDALTENASPIEANDMQGADGLLVDVRWHQGAKRALSWARDKEVPGVLDFDLGFRDESLLGLASHVVCSREAMAAVSATDDVAQGLRYVHDLGSAWVGVTAGEDGTYWLDNGSIAHHPGYAVEVVDTLAAGDVYHGAFALAIASQPDDTFSAVRIASAAAAISCTRVGGRLGIPDKDELDRFMRENE